MLLRLKICSISLTLTAILAGCDVTSNSSPVKGLEDVQNMVLTEGAVTVFGEVWVDNWFSLYVNGTKVIEDSVPIATERSFNAERFTFNADFPMTFAFELRDFMQNETGLEYIGTSRQQMGDGGAIFQFQNGSNGKLIAASGSQFKCLAIQSAPVNASCAKQANPVVNSGDCAQVTTKRPENWQSPAFDDSAWPTAIIHTAQAVAPKDGYNEITWNDAAQFIWSSDLAKDNILLCRASIPAG